MINLSVADTIDERTINKKKLTPFTIQVSRAPRSDNSLQLSDCLHPMCPVVGSNRRT